MKKRPLLDRDWPASRVVPLFLLFIAAMVGGNVIPPSRTSRIYCTFTLIWCAIGFVLFWYAHGMANRHVPTYEDIDEKFRSETNQTLNVLKSDLQSVQQKVDEQTPRTLSKHQQEIILAAISPYSGQKASVWCWPGEKDCATYAAQFANVLQKAKWDISGYSICIDIYTCDSVGVMVSENWNVGKERDAVVALGMAMTKNWSIS